MQILKTIQGYADKFPTGKKPLVDKKDVFYVSSNSFNVGIPGKFFATTMTLPPEGSAVVL